MRQPGVEPGSIAWKATMLTATPPTRLNFCWSRRYLRPAEICCSHKYPNFLLFVFARFLIGCLDASNHRHRGTDCSAIAIRKKSNNANRYKVDFANFRIGIAKSESHENCKKLIASGLQVKCRWAFEPTYSELSLSNLSNGLFCLSEILTLTLPLRSLSESVALPYFEVFFKID